MDIPSARVTEKADIATPEWNISLMQSLSQ